MRYFFHNIYGDADELIATAPDDVEVHAFGWDSESEQNRNDLLSELGCSVSSLPCVLYWHPERIVYNGTLSPTIVAAGYEEVRLDSIGKPWTWTAIDDEIERRIQEWPDI